jgi:hypothetical protein
MDQSNESATNPSVNFSLDGSLDLPLGSVPVEGPIAIMSSPAADRVYQLAAVTFGIFLLATLL